MRQCSLEMKIFLCRKVPKTIALLPPGMRHVRQETSVLCRSHSEGSADLGSRGCAWCQRSDPVCSRMRNDGNGRQRSPGGSLLNILASPWATAVQWESTKMSFTALVSLGEGKHACYGQISPPTFVWGKLSQEGPVALGVWDVNIVPWRTLRGQLLQGSGQGRVWRWSSCSSHTYLSRCSHAPASACVVVWIRMHPLAHIFECWVFNEWHTWKD